MKNRINIESGFKWMNVSLIILAIIIGTVLPVILWFNSGKINDGFLFYFGLPMVGLMTILSIFIELPKIKKVGLSDNGIEIGRPFIGQNKTIPYRDLDGFKFQYQATSYDVYKSILLYKNGRIIHEISELYIDNIREIENYLKTKVDYLGEEKFRFFKNIISRIA